MIAREYLTQQAATLLKLASVTSSESAAAALKAKAADLQAKTIDRDSSAIPPQAPQKT